MKNAIFQLKRNDVFTLITNLRKFVKAHDRAMSETSDYQMIQNSELTITLRIGEQCKSQPSELQKSLTQ